MRLLALLLCLAICGGCGASEPPGSFTPRILLGADLLDKQHVFRDARIGHVTDIKFVEQHDPPVVVVAGTKGAAFLAVDTFQVQRVVQYHRRGQPMTDHHVVDADADGELEFAREPHAAADAALIDGNGDVVWQRTPPGRGFPFAAFGDVNGDRKLDFLLWTSNNQELVDHSGKSRWEQQWSGNISKIQLIDLDQDGRDEIVAIDGESLIVRDGDGKLMRQTAINDAHYVNYLEKTSYPFAQAGARILLGYNFQDGNELRQTFRVVAADGSTVVGDIPPEELPLYTTQVAAQLRGQPTAYRVGHQSLKYQGGLVGYSATRLQFTLYDDRRRTVYDEIIASSDGASVPSDGDVEVISSAGEQHILLGYGPDVWEYRGKAPK